MTILKFSAPMMHRVSKSSRNNLIKHNAVFDGNVCSFRHIVDMYNEDIKHIPRAVPKLTHNHVELAPYAEMRVRLATQTLSVNVSIKTYVHNKLLSKDCLNTATYCESFDKLFDCANSTSFNATKVIFYNKIYFLKCILNISNIYRNCKDL